jgi:hypothetical protein
VRISRCSNNKTLHIPFACRPHQNLERARGELFVFRLPDSSSDNDSHPSPRVTASDGDTLLERVSFEPGRCPVLALLFSDRHVTTGTIVNSHIFTTSSRHHRQYRLPPLLYRSSSLLPDHLGTAARPRSCSWRLGAVGYEGGS